MPTTTTILLQPHRSTQLNPLFLTLVTKSYLIFLNILDITLISLGWMSTEMWAIFLHIQVMATCPARQWFTLQLADSWAKQAEQETILQQAHDTQAEQEALILALQKQIEEMKWLHKDAEIQSQKNTPYLSGSRVSPQQILVAMRLCSNHRFPRIPDLFEHWRTE